MGGVTAMGRLSAAVLRKHGHEVTTAWRAYYADAPELSARPWQSLSRRPTTGDTSDAAGKRLAVGTYLPEFEWAHHQPWGPWRDLLDGHARVVVASGSNLTGWAPVKLGRPSLQWIASPFDPDRAERISTWPRWRRVYDGALNAWICRRQERRILEAADTISISGYTERGLATLTSGARTRGVVPIPVDIDRFSRGDRAVPDGRPLRIGFNGRVSDPRKNMKLLVDAVAIADRLTVGPPVPHADMPDWYRFLDVFVIASHQEGLSIVGTEAMACGTVVVSTRCGGPEDFVIEGESGLLCGFAADDMARRFLDLAASEPLRARLAAGGVDLIRERYAHAAFERLYMEAFDRAFA